MKIFETEVSLKIALQKRERDAYEYVYNLYYNELYHFARSYMLSSIEADDIIHDAFVTLLEKSQNISEKSDIKGYMYLTVKHLCLNTLKHYNVICSREMEVVNEWNFCMQDYDEDEEDQLVSRINKLIEKLPLQQQAVLKLKSSGKSYDEIAENLNISKLTVNVHVKRAYQFIRENIFIFHLFFLKIVYLIFRP